MTLLAGKGFTLAGSRAGERRQVTCGNRLPSKPGMARRVTAECESSISKRGRPRVKTLLREMKAATDYARAGRSRPSAPNGARGVRRAL